MLVLACTMIGRIGAGGPRSVPPPILPSCLNGTLPPPSVGLADDGLIHVAFFDTRPRPDTAAMLAAAKQIRKAGGAEAVRFHVLLHAKFQLEVPGMSRTPLRLPAAAQCLFSGLKRLAHGPGPAYLYKPLLHFLLPSVRKLILLDTDTVVLRPIAELWRHFSHFGGAVLGVANEQTNMYQRASGWTEIGKNGGVQLLHLHAMRTSTEYNRVLEGYASGAEKRWIGYLGDQTLYTHLAARSGSGGLVYTLPCEWNRQISMQFGFRNRTIHACPRQCALLHANFRPLKCVVGVMQGNPSCTTWSAFWQRSAKQVKGILGLKGPRVCGATVKWNEFQRAVKEYFADCCVGGI